MKSYFREVERKRVAEKSREAAACREAKLTPLDLSIQEMQQFQEGDETLAVVRKEAKGEFRQVGRGFFKKEGVIYRRWMPPGRDKEEMVVKQLHVVLPWGCRRVVLELAHSISLADHMGKNKTAQSILQRFYWLMLYKDMADYCKICAECQKISNRKGRTASLISLPNIEVPFPMDCHGCCRIATTEPFRKEV